MEKKLVSIIVPVYKVEKYLRKCVDSILAQTYKNLEIILVDDGSPDACPAICDEYARLDKRIKVIHKLNGGVSSARNAGLNAATGEYIQFVDSDDWIDKDYTAKLIQSMIISKCDLVISGFRHVYMKKIEYKKIESFIKIYLFSARNADLKKLTFFLYSSCNKLYKTELIKNNRFSEINIAGEDTLFVLDYLKNCETISTVTDVFYNYNRQNETSATKFFSEKMFNNHKIIFEKKLQFLNLFCNNETKDYLTKTFKYEYAYSVLVFVFLIFKNNGSLKEKISRIEKIAKDPDFVARKKLLKGFREKIILLLLNLKMYRLLNALFKLKKLK